MEEAGGGRLYTRRVLELRLQMKIVDYENIKRSISILFIVRGMIVLRSFFLRSSFSDTNNKLMYVLGWKGVFELASFIVLSEHT